jgi:hypothetical protein
LATGTQNQETLGAADFGAINGNEITIKLGLDKVNAAVGANVLGTTSTATNAKAQIMIGSSLSGGLLLSSDQASGSDFEISNSGTGPTPTPTPTVTPTATPMPDPTPTSTPSPTPQPTPAPDAGSSTSGRFDERYSDTLNVGEGVVEVPFQLRRSYLDAQINQNQGNQEIVFELLDANRNFISSATAKKIQRDNLPLGTYIYRVRGSVTKDVDFTIKSGQGK